MHRVKQKQHEMSHSIKYGVHQQIRDSEMRQKVLSHYGFYAPLVLSGLLYALHDTGTYQSTAQ